MLQYLREKLLSCESHEKIERQFDIFMEQEAADRVVTKAIEMLEINNKKWIYYLKFNFACIILQWKLKFVWTTLYSVRKWSCQKHL